MVDDKHEMRLVSVEQRRRAIEADALAASEQAFRERVQDKQRGVQAQYAALAAVEVVVRECE
jgi:hypothetical protein